MKKLVLVALLVALFAPFALHAALLPVRATFGGDVATFFKGSYGNDRFIIDKENRYVRGNVNLMTSDGENILGFNGTIDPVTNVIEATLSGADDWSYDPDRTNKTSSYLRTAYDGTWKATLVSKVGGTYVWSGPMSLNYITVISRQTPDGISVPQERVTYNGTLSLAMEEGVISGSLASEVTQTSPSDTDVITADNPALISSSSTATGSDISASSTDTEIVSSTTAETTPPSNTKWLIGVLVILALLVIVVLAWPKKSVA